MNYTKNLFYLLMLFDSFIQSLIIVYWKKS